MRIILLILVLSVSGCAHCSKTKSVFDGQSSGINPYGKGRLQIVRESFWGTKSCIDKVKFNNVETLKKEKEK